MSDPVQISLPLDLVNAALVALGECKAKDVYNIIGAIQAAALPQIPPELLNADPSTAPAADSTPAPATDSAQTTTA